MSCECFDCGRECECGEKYCERCLIKRFKEDEDKNKD